MSLLFIPGILQTPDEPVIHNKNSRRYRQLLEHTFDEAVYLETQLTWKLDRFMGIFENPMEFYPILPVNKLRGGLTAERVIAQLNTDACIQWDYLPHEGDYLKIGTRYVAKTIPRKDRPDLREYMAFVYSNQKWEEGFYDYDADEVSKQRYRSFRRRRRRAAKITGCRRYNSASRPLSAPAMNTDGRSLFPAP
jgi:hypothetical protein